MTGPADRYYVIGSGPAGVAAACALLERGLKVTLIDPGVVLEPERRELRERLAGSEPREWRAADLSAYRAGLQATTGGIPKKTVYGSDYVYREPAGACRVLTRGAKVMRSYAEGGLSNVWGTCFLPYPQEEMAAWPTAARDLARHYRAVADLVPHVARDDLLSERLPLHAELYGEPLPSRQALDLERDLDARRQRLRERGITYGAARIALDNTGGACRRCGLCLYGCPYGLLYATGTTLRQLMERGLEYRPGLLVTHLESRADGCRISAREVGGGAPRHFEARRVFLASGLLETATIVLRSLAAYDRPVKLCHSDRFMLPMLRLAGTRGVRTERLHTLSQLFVEVLDPSISANSIHLQVYTYNDLMAQALENRLGPLKRPLSWGLERILERLIVLFGYIHSDDSQGLQYVLRRSPQEHLEVIGQRRLRPRRIAWQVAARMLRELRAFRAIPAMPLLDPPGGGNHTGGSFPMRDRPAGLETDIWGTLPDLPYVHLVDSSVFPSVPAATIVYTAMANAHRIASTCKP